MHDLCLNEVLLKQTRVKYNEKCYKNLGLYTLSFYKIVKMVHPDVVVYEKNFR